MTVETSEGRRFPLYYALVGWPSLAFPDQTGWFLMRLVNAVLCSAFLASGAYVLFSMCRRPLVLAAGLFVGLTPLAVNLAGSVNPSGLEVATAFCVWAVVLAMVHGTSSLPPRRVIGIGAVSSVAARHQPGAGVRVDRPGRRARADLREPERRAEFVRARSTRVLLACAAGATIVMAAWSVAFRSFDTFHTPPASATGFGPAVSASYRHVGRLLQQTLAYLGYLTIPPPRVAELGWALAVLAIVGLAVVTNRRVGLAVLLGCAIVLVMPFVIEVATYSSRGLVRLAGSVHVAVRRRPAAPRGGADATEAPREAVRAAARRRRRGLDGRRAVRRVQERVGSARRSPLVRAVRRRALRAGRGGGDRLGRVGRPALAAGIVIARTSRGRD